MPNSRVTNRPMPRGRPKLPVEEMPAHPGFRATDDQMEWLRAAGLAEGFANLSDWLKELAVKRGETVLKTPFPRRKLVDPKRRPK
jgi:hypothetical protein